MSNTILENKPKSSFPKSILKEIKLLSMDRFGDNLKVIGSSSYRASLYPSDIDCYEEITKKSKDELIKHFKTRIQTIVRNITKLKNHYFMEVKCGIDKRYDLYVTGLGERIGNKYILKEEIPYFFNSKLFDKDEIIKASEIWINSNKGQECSILDYETLKKIVRKHYIIRWDAKEIKQGYKILRGNIKITLEQALNMESRINIEILAIVNNKVTDLSNFFVLIYKDPKLGELVLNLPQSAITDYTTYFSQQIKEAMKNVIENPLEYNPIKYAKRIFSYARFMKNKELSNKILPVINSSDALVYQTKGEIGTIIKLLESKYYNKIPIRIVKNQIQQIKYRLSSFPFLSNEVLEKFNIVIDTINKNKYNKDEMIEILTVIKKILGEYVDNSVTNKLINMGLLPIPSYLRN